MEVQRLLCRAQVCSKRKESQRDYDIVRSTKKLVAAGNAAGIEVALYTELLLPGGMSAKTFKVWAKIAYGLDITLERAQELRDLWFAAYPEMKQHLRPPVDQLTLRDNIRRYCSRNGLKVVNDSVALKQQMEKTGKFTRKEIYETIRGMTYYLGMTTTGLTQRGLDYCSACNFPFQSLAAQGLKEALWLLYLDGFQICNEIHDEVLIYHKEDKYLQDNIKRVEELMLQGMRKVCPDVKIDCESTLMRRWAKGAKPIYNTAGELLVWEPED
jgi:DNA polymerase I-like protein with 3'-5' exonuclease and polymerase domains